MAANDDRLVEIINLIKGNAKQHNENFKKLDERLSSFEKSMEFINSQFQNFKKMTENLSSANMKLEKKNEELTQEVKKVKTALEIANHDINDLEQYGRRDCVELNGIPREVAENVESLVIKTGSMLGIQVEPKDIQACHRLGKNKTLQLYASSRIAKQQQHSSEQEN